MSEPTTPLRTRPLGLTGVELSEVALGTWGLATDAYGPLADRALEDTVEAAWRAGVRTFDVAPLWGDGSGERRLGSVLGKRIDEATIIARVGQVGTPAGIEARFDPESILREVDKSLARLGRTRIDVLLLHNPPPKVLAARLHAKGIARLRDENLIRAWGVSVATAMDAALAIECDAEAVCLPYNLFVRDLVEAIAPAARDRGVALLARSPLQHGVLGGRYGADTIFPADDHRTRRYFVDGWRRRMHELESYRFLVDEQCPDLATAALRFTLANQQVATTIVGARSPEQATHAASASTAPPYLPAEHLRRLLEGASPTA